VFRNYFYLAVAIALYALVLSKSMFGCCSTLLVSYG